MNENKNEINLSELELQYKDESYIPYAEYLKTTEWKMRRFDILGRDKFMCVKCNGHPTRQILKKNSTAEKKEYETIWKYGIREKIDTIVIYTKLNGQSNIVKTSRPPEEPPKKQYVLQIHHKKYITNRLPWEYEDEDLETLCHHCHYEVHLSEKIPIYTENGLELLDYTNCGRCSGTGYFPEYKHVSNGVCFECHGDRFSVKLMTRK